MAVQKNFKITNGLEVNNNLIFADAGSGKVGIATTFANYTLDVGGSVGVTSAYIADSLNIDGKIGINNNYGLDGSYLVSTGTGVTWKNLPGLRYSQTYTATAGLSTFSFSYNPSGGIDVYVNGVRLSESEYSAVNGTSIVLDQGCYDGDTVDLVAYSVSALGVGVSGITGLTVLDEGVTVGNEGNIISVNFVGAAISATSSGFGVTVSVSGGVWNENEYGDVYRNSFVGIGTDIPVENLDVDGNIRFTGTLYQGNEEYVASRWTLGAGTTIYRDSFVGIGSTLPQKTLDVGGDINFSGSLFQGGSAFVASRWTAGVGNTIYRDNDGFVGVGTSVPTQNLDVNGNVRIRGDLYSSQNNVGTAGSVLYTAGSGSGTYWGAPVGTQGATGSQGTTGTQGSQGVQGLSNQGVQGSIGIQGLGGIQGSQGTQGIQGFNGTIGVDGAQGSTGSQGSQGSQGLQGLQGLLGPQGIIGIQGDIGSQGSQGVQGLSNQGVQGSIGIQGLGGIQGSQGVQGLSNQGVQGSIGSQGNIGAQGSQGVQGLSNQGVQGSQGSQGTFGPATIPQNSQTTSYQVASTDNGKHISITTGGVTVPVGIGFGAGDNVVIFNDSGSNQTVTSGVGITMYLAGTASTGNRTLYQRGIATILCISSNRYVISGAGLT
jgi:hypothetical protein